MTRLIFNQASRQLVDPMNRFEPGLLDKLFGDGAHQPAPAVVRRLSLDELKGAVAGHIESLLIARPPLPTCGSPGSSNASGRC